MSEDRLIDIESKLAHQEQLLNELNDVITEQQARIMQLEQLSSTLIERVRTLGDAGTESEPADQRPPHY